MRQNFPKFLGAISFALAFGLQISTAQELYGWSYPRVGPLGPAASLSEYALQVPEADWQESEPEESWQVRMLKAGGAVALDGHKYDLALVQKALGGHTVSLTRISTAQSAIACELEASQLISALEPDNGKFEHSVDGQGSIVWQCLDDGVSCPELRRDVAMSTGSTYSTYSAREDGSLFRPSDAEDTSISFHATAAQFSEPDLMIAAPKLLVRSIFKDGICTVGAGFSTDSPKFAFRIKPENLTFIQVPTIGAKHNAIELLNEAGALPVTVRTSCDVEMFRGQRTICRGIDGEGLNAESAKKLKPLADLFAPNISPDTVDAFSIIVFENEFDLTPADRLRLRFSDPVAVSFDYAERQGFKPLIENRSHANDSVHIFVQQSKSKDGRIPQTHPVSVMCVVQSDYSLGCEHQLKPKTDPWLYNYAFQKASMFLAPEKLSDGKSSIGRTLRLNVKDYAW